MAVPIELQGHKFSIDLFVLSIEGLDVVLGIQWLQLFGRVSHDYSTSTMEFLKDDRSVVLKGEASLVSTPIC